MGRRRGVVGVTLGAVLVLVAAACTPAQDGRTTTVDHAQRARAATHALNESTDRSLSCANVVMSEDKRTTAAPEDLVLLTDARAIAEPCWDKIEFQFQPIGRDVPPGYEIEYREGPFTEGDHNQYTVNMLGDAFLYVTFAPAASVDFSNPARPIQMYKGNLLLTLIDMHHTEMVRKIIDGDGTVSWIIGLDVRRPFTVDAINHPPHVNIYIAK